MSQTWLKLIFFKKVRFCAAYIGYPDSITHIFSPIQVLSEGEEVLKLACVKNRTGRTCSPAESAFAHLKKEKFQVRFNFSHLPNQFSSHCQCIGNPTEIYE